MVKTPSRSLSSSDVTSSNIKSSNITPSTSLSSSNIKSSTYPNLCRPTINETFLAIKLLSDLHGIPERLSTSQTVLDSLVRTILSQNTTDKNSRIAYNKLKTEYPTWKSVLNASDSNIIECIRFGGLAEIKTKRIKDILISIMKDHPNECKQDISLDFLKNMSTEDIKNKLLKFKGVGPKTISCVLMFCLQRDDFPVGIIIIIIFIIILLLLLLLLLLLYLLSYLLSYYYYYIELYYF